MRSNTKLTYALQGKSIYLEELEPAWLLRRGMFNFPIAEFVPKKAKNTKATRLLQYNGDKSATCN